MPVRMLRKLRLERNKTVALDVDSCYSIRRFLPGERQSVTISVNQMINEYGFSMSRGKIHSRHLNQRVN